MKMNRFLFHCWWVGDTPETYPGPEFESLRFFWRMPGVCSEGVCWGSLRFLDYRSAPLAKNPGILGYIRDFTTKLYGDCKKPLLRIPIKHQ